MEWIKTILNAVRVAMDGVSAKVDRLNAWAKTFAWVPVMSERDDVILQNTKITATDGNYMFTSTIPTDGATYNVTINGASYQATAKTGSSDGQPMTILGDYLVNPDGDLPFLFGWTKGVAVLYTSITSQDGAYVVSIIGRTVKANKLPEDFVPDSVWRKIESLVKPTDPVFTGTFSHNRKDDSAIGDYSHAEGHDTTASGKTSHAEGEVSKASGPNSHAEGWNTTASGSNSHAEGWNTTASGSDSHAEGYNTKASEFNSHAEGHSTTASGSAAHAEGHGTTASGSLSHAEGENTTASGDNSHVQGKYNIEDKSGKYAHIVGNGTDLAKRSNAHTLDWHGVPWFQGRPQFGGTAQDNGSQSVVANGDKEIILASSTEGSTKKFKITVDDSGVLTATEITE